MNTRPPAVAVVVVAPLRSVFPRVLKLPAPLLARPLLSIDIDISNF